MPQTAAEVVQRLEQRAAATEAVDESTLPPVTDCVEPAALASLSSDYGSDASLHSCLRFVWGTFVTTVYADGRVIFRPADDVRPSEAARRAVFTQYSAALDRAYERVRDSACTDGGTTDTPVRGDGGTDTPTGGGREVRPSVGDSRETGRGGGVSSGRLGVADGIRTTGHEVEAYTGELFAATLGESVGTSVPQVVDCVDPEPGDVVSVTGTAVAANEAVGDQLLSTLGDSGALVSTTRPGQRCQAAIDTELTVLDCAGGRPSDTVQCLDSCDDMTTVGTEILEAIDPETGVSVFGFNTLSHLAPAAQPGDHLRFLSTLTQSLRRLEVGGVFVGRPLSLNPQRLAEQVDYHVESRRTDDRVELRVCGKPDVSDAWRPVELSGHITT